MNTNYERMFSDAMSLLSIPSCYNVKHFSEDNVTVLEEGKDYKVIMTDKEKIALSFMILACIIIACGVGMMISAIVSMMK